MNQPVVLPDQMNRHLQPNLHLPIYKGEKMVSCNTFCGIPLSESRIRHGGTDRVFENGYTIYCYTLSYIQIFCVLTTPSNELLIDDTIIGWTVCHLYPTSFMVTLVKSIITIYTYVICLFLRICSHNYVNLVVRHLATLISRYAMQCSMCQSIININMLICYANICLHIIPELR
jgi:hypothetical protein